MAEFINTVDLLGDGAVIDSIIDKTIPEFKDDSVTKVGDYAFYNCANLTKVDCPEVTDIGSNAFSNCSALTTVHFPKATGVGKASFYKCQGLKNLDLPMVKTTGSGAFEECTALESVKLPNLESAGAWFLRGANLIKVLDFHNLKSCSAQSFGMGGLTALILRRTDGLCTGNSGMFNSHSQYIKPPIPNGAGYIYVPRALVDSYKAATNWSTYATQFRALEDYTVDGTITGELDESKI